MLHQEQVAVRVNHIVSCMALPLPPHAVGEMLLVPLSCCDRFLDAFLGAGVLKQREEIDFGLDAAFAAPVCPMALGVQGVRGCLPC